MDNKAFFNLVYGLCVLSSKADGKTNACVINTCIQVASNPTRLAISCINGNLTPELIKKSGLFTLSMLDKNTTYSTVKRFGMQSGRDVDKFDGFGCGYDANGLPYLTYEANAMFSCKVVESHDLGSHTLFIGEVLDAQVIGSMPSLTYAEYHSTVKPKPGAPAADKKVKAWRCKICGFVYEGAVLPDDYICPLCTHPKDDFEPVYE